MSAELDSLRLCPTPVDKRQTLLAHKITVSMCAERQRQGYHKCPTCSFQVRSNGKAHDAHPPAPLPVRLLPDRAETGRLESS
jgi:hypothetical protein